MSVRSVARRFGRTGGSDALLGVLAVVGHYVVVILCGHRARTPVRAMAAQLLLLRFRKIESFDFSGHVRPSRRERFNLRAATDTCARKLVLKETICCI